MENSSKYAEWGKLSREPQNELKSENILVHWMLKPKFSLLAEELDYVVGPPDPEVLAAAHKVALLHKR